MGNALQNKTVVVIGRGSGIARAITLLARSEGAQVVVAGRDKAKLAAQYADPGISAHVVDVTDDRSIAALAERLNRVDHFAHISATNPARRIGTPADIADAVLFAMTNTFLTGVTLKVDGGEPLT